MNQLCRLIAEILGVEYGEVGPQTGPGTVSKWDSFAHIQLVAAIEETYGVQLSTDEIGAIRSIGDFATLLREKGVSLD
jgi:acyl carrier protein